MFMSIVMLFASFAGLLHSPIMMSIQFRTVLNFHLSLLYFSSCNVLNIQAHFLFEETLLEISLFIFIVALQLRKE